MLLAAHLSPGFVKGAATIPFAMAVIVITVGLLRVLPSGRSGPAELQASIMLGLEFLLAAGLLRLAVLDSFAALGMVAGIIALRRLIGAGLRFAVRALGPADPSRLRA
jgi:uncharacterized membrane protein